MAEPAKKDPTPYERFESLTKRLVRVPKKEIDAREKAREKRKDKKS